MINSKFFTLLGAILIYYTLVPDISSENGKLIEQIRLVEHKLHSQENGSHTVKTVQKLIQQSKTINTDNKKLFLDASLPEALAFDTFQQLIRHDANQSGAEITNISWGEPSSKDESPYTLLPMSVALKCSPKGCSDFFKRLTTHKTLVYVENLSMVKYQNDLSVVADLYAYRIRAINPALKDKQ